MTEKGTLKRKNLLDLTFDETMFSRNLLNSLSIYFNEEATPLTEDDPDKNPTSELDLDTDDNDVELNEMMNQELNQANFTLCKDWVCGVTEDD